MKRTLGIIVSLIAMVLMALPATAADYPSKPITAYIPLAAGGTTDVFVRTIAPYMEQHLGESLAVIFIATAIAMLFLWMAAIPYYNQTVGNRFTFSDIMNLQNVGSLIVLSLLLGIVAGLYPAFFASRFHPTHAIKAVKQSRSFTVRLRKGLVIFQFAISIFMIFCTITIYKQLNLFHRMDYGFHKDRIAAVRLYGGGVLPGTPGNEALLGFGPEQFNRGLVPRGEPP